MKNIIPIILILVFVGILFLLDLPAYNKVAFLRDEVKRHKELLKEKEELLIKVDQLKQVYNSRKDEIDKVYYTLPSGKDIPNLIVQFEALVSENGLILEKLNFLEDKVIAKAGLDEDEIDETRAPEEYKSLGVSLSVSGTYESFKSFLEALELNVRLMDIKSINFSSQKEEGSIFTFNIELKTYYQ